MMNRNIQTILLSLFLLVAGNLSAQTMTFHEFLLRTPESMDHREMLLRFTEPTQLQTPIDCEKMSWYMGSTSYQTMMVYKLSGNSGKLMTPLAFTHFLADDIFSHKIYGAMVSKNQKSGLRLRMRMMDYSIAGTKVTPEIISSHLVEYGITEMTVNEVTRIMKL